LLNPARYRHRTQITSRFADLDPNDHINNVAIAAMFEDARVRFNKAMGITPDRRPGGRRFMVAAVEINYLAQAHFPDPLECVTAPIGTGTTSWRLLQVLLQDAVPVATAQSVLVSIIDDRPAPLSDDLIAALGPWMLQ
jgi:acyl-CoA thioester hydrolase